MYVIIKKEIFWNFLLKNKNYYIEGDKMIDQLNLRKFNDVYNKTYNCVLKYVVSKCSNIDDVNDIIQEIYLEVYNMINKKKSIDNLNKYIIGIAKNKIKKYYGLLYKIRTVSLFKTRDDDFDLLDNIKSNINIEEIILKDYDIDIIWNYLKSKKAVIQKIFYLYYELDLTIKEISNELKVGESYIKNYLYRTLKELQDLFRKDCD